MHENEGRRDIEGKIVFEEDVSKNFKTKLEI